MILKANEKNDKIKSLQQYCHLFNEGYGTAYERFSLNKFIIGMVNKYNISTVLEMPANGIMGIPGIKSMIFAKLGCKVTVSHPSQEFLNNAKRIWDCFGLEADFVKSYWINSVFNDDSFDLVWNFCVYEHFENPKEVVREMLRVTKKYIFIENQNIHNIGLPLHRLYHILKNETWDHGNVQQMRLSNLRKIIDELNAIEIDIGATDMPPWPDINIRLKQILSEKDNKGVYNELRPMVRTKEISEVINEIKSFQEFRIKDKIIYYLFNIWYFIEDRIPFILKGFLAHHPYIIAKKI